MKKHNIIALSLIIFVTLLTSCKYIDDSKQIVEKESTTTSPVNTPTIDVVEDPPANTTDSNELLYTSDIGLILNIPEEIKDIIIIKEDEDTVYINHKCTVECCDNRQRVAAINALPKDRLSREEAINDPFYCGENSSSYFFISGAIDFAHSQEKFINQFKENSPNFEQLFTNLSFYDK